MTNSVTFRLSLIAVLSTGLAVLGVTRAIAGFDKDAAKAFCEAEWGNDFRMVAYCVDRQWEGAERLERLRKGLDETMLERLAVCEIEWKQDMRMQAYCLEQQISARKDLSYATDKLPEDVAKIIREECAADWGTDFRMLLYCTEQQAKAWAKLNN